MSFELIKYTEKIKKEWDEFVSSCPMGSIHQISDWKTFQEQIPGRGEVLGFCVKKDNKILATTFCVRMETGFLGKFWYYSARGPVFDIRNKSAMAFLLKELNKKLKDRGGIFWRIDPYLETTNCKALCSGPKGVNMKRAIQNYQPTDTLEIDLTMKEEEILAQMKRRGRNGINKSIKKGIEIKVIEKGTFTEQDLEDFYKLNKETTFRDKFSGHSIDYYRNFLTNLKEYAVLFFATYNGQPIASAISTFCGDKAIYYFGASTSDRELNKLKAPTLLQWEMMKYGKRNKCKTYDFLGIAPENQPKHAYAGISQFKHGFGGYRKTYQAGKEIILNKFWYFVYKIGKKIK
jgi:lipid II:glycine glycyltransferase (peptidoglycan interpeptide bridge formation enzyme)